MNRVQVLFGCLLCVIGTYITAEAAKPTAVPAETPRWRVMRYDPVTSQIIGEEKSIIVVDATPNRYQHQYLKLVQAQITLPNGTKSWYPAVMGVNGILAFGYTGLEMNHTILAFAPNTECSGRPVALVRKRWSLETKDLTIAQRGNIAYDFRTGEIFRGLSGGTETSNLNFDLLEYGYAKGFFPNGLYGCSININLRSRADLTEPTSPDSSIIFYDFDVIGTSSPSAGENLGFVFQ